MTLDDNAPKQELEIDWDTIVNQIFEMIGTEAAIINRYGIILSSRIKGFDKNRLISPIVWEMIQKQKVLTKELNVKKVGTIALETDVGNLVVSIGQNLYLLTLVPAGIDLAKYMPSLMGFIATLDKTRDTGLGVELVKLNLDDEYAELNKENSNEPRQDHFPIFKDLIRFISGN
jgi:hypothetical protein